MSLGFGSEVANIHSDAAKRSNQRAREQVQTVLDRIDHVVQDGDWSGHVERVRGVFAERGGKRMLEDAREDFRLHLLDDDPGFSAKVAELLLASLDRAISAASEGDLNQVVGHMRGTMKAALRAFESPEMGRQPIDLMTLDDSRAKKVTKSGGGSGGGNQDWCAARDACIAWAVSSFVASMIVCFAIPFIWCSWSFQIVASFGGSLALCMAIFQSLCSGAH
jgi:hypothetical protein